ncbi:hypothetical protein Ddye_026773 [Dipteronia dyeriana]|uniref:Pectinesterase n=1 Tax=Dipteronia dyeriana TaxID=168575 RepID=A0AAD9TNL5_9ROSI|nr:hypothetical protein Ddye_026773 [Dipteronia dyeriana]
MSKSDPRSRTTTDLKNLTRISMEIVYDEAIELKSLFIKAGENATDPFLKMNIRLCIDEFGNGSYRVKRYGIPYFDKGEYANAISEIGFIVDGSSSCNDTGTKLFNKEVETSFNFSCNVLDLLKNTSDPILKMNIRLYIGEFDISSYHVKTYGISYFDKGDYANANGQIGYIVGGSSNCNDTGTKLFNKEVENSFNFSCNVLYLLNIKSSYFLARDMSIINNAGSNAGQAVALSTEGDYIACYRCSIEGYQDTLYTIHGRNQFFSYCNIYGTVDFIFGDAAVVIQNSYIGVRLPSGGQTVVTADGRIDGTLNTAIVIHNCSISPTPELKGNPNVKTYLGRPWKEFSRTVIMQSYLDAFIDPQGWLKFDSSSDLASLYYAEYGNSGNGSFTGDITTNVSLGPKPKTSNEIKFKIQMSRDEREAAQGFKWLRIGDFALSLCLLIKHWLIKTANHV